MFANYACHLKQVLREINPAHNRQIMISILIYVAVFSAIYSTFEVSGITPDDTPFIFLGGMFVVSVALFALYNVLGLLLEFTNHPQTLGEKFRKTGLVLTRSTGFLIINILLSVTMFTMMDQSIHDVLVENGYISKATFISEVVVLECNPSVFIVFGILWYLFPKWFLYSMPISYDKRLYSADVKRNLRRTVPPAVTFLFLINFPMASYEYVVTHHISTDESIGIAAVNVLTAVGAAIRIAGLVVALVSAARASTLSEKLHGPIDEVEIDESSVEKLASVSSKIAAWKLIPYTDGRFAYYPSSRWNKGYILTSNQAARLFSEVQKKGISFTQLLIIGGIAGGLGGGLSNIWESRSINVGWIIAFFIALALFAHIIETHIKPKKLKERFGNLPVCKHPFPADYFRLRTLTVRFFSIWSLSIIVVVFSAMTALSIFAFFGDGGEALGSLVSIIAVLMFMAIDAIYLWLFYCQLKFRWRNGRGPVASDLRPIDPLTGKMVSSPHTA